MYRKWDIIFFRWLPIKNIYLSKHALILLCSKQKNFILDMIGNKSYYILYTNLDFLCEKCTSYCVYFHNIHYRAFKMDWGHFKELLCLRFWCQVERCVHYLEYEFLQNFLMVTGRWFVSFFKFLAKSKFEKWAKSYTGPLKNWIFFLFQIPKCTHFSIIKMMGEKCLEPKMNSQ